MVFGPAECLDKGLFRFQILQIWLHSTTGARAGASNFEVTLAPELVQVLVSDEFLDLQLLLVQTMVLEQERELAIQLVSEMAIALELVLGLPSLWVRHWRWF